jgi:hypothetical protein
MGQVRREERRRVCMSNRCTGGALDSCRVSRCPCLLPLLHVVACPGAAPSHARGRNNECLPHLAHAWKMRTRKLFGRTAN